VQRARKKQSPTKNAESKSAITPEKVFRECSRIYTLARRMLGNDADAEDVTQDVLLRVVRKLSTFRGDSSFPTWLHRVTVNAALTYGRNRARREKHRVYDPLEQFTDDRGQRFLAERRSMSPDQLILDKEAQEVVENAIARMPEIYHQVYVLADIEKLPNDDIAGILGLTILAVKSRLHRARLWMRNTLAPYFEVQAA
jgi:RNA polymerase sigma-70 factor (ECF subfamily)